MTSTPTFGTPLLGQTEKALNAILARQLAGTTLTEPQWVTLTLALTIDGGDSVDGEELERRVAGVLKVDDAQAQAHVRALATVGLVRSEGCRVEVTAAGRELHGGIRAAVTQITQRLWGDVPADDLAAAGRVLATVLARADAELAGA